MLLEDKTILENVKKGVKESFIASLLFIIFAIVLLLNPENFMNIAINVFGYIAIASGILGIVLYFKLPKEQRIFSDYFVNSILLIVFGIIAFAENDIIKEVVTLFIGGYLIYRNARRAGMAMNIQSYSKTLWIYLLVISAINIVIGFFIVINPFTSLIRVNEFIAIMILVSETFMIVENTIVLIGMKKYEKNHQDNK